MWGVEAQSDGISGTASRRDKMAVGAILRRTVPGRLTLRVVIVSHGHSSTYVARSDEYDGLHKPSMARMTKYFCRNWF